MARAAAMENEPLNLDLSCPICLEFLNEPVTLPNCFHSFCKRCLMQTIDGAREDYRDPYTCPQCRSDFSPSECERINHHLQNIVESHKRGQDRSVEIHQIRDQDSNQIELLNATLIIADAFVQSLVTAIDRVAVRAANVQQRVRRDSVDSYSNNEETETHVQELLHTDCDFEATTSQEFLSRSVALFRRHFLLIMFIILASVFVVCLFEAMV